MKRYRDDFENDSEVSLMSSHHSPTNYTEISAGSTKRPKLGNTFLEDENNDANSDSFDKSVQQIDSREVDVDDAMTQVDMKWSEKSRRRRSMDKMTQAPIFYNQASCDTSPSQAGIIEKLELSNFMCHTNFSLSFGPQTNFIIGRNGSGKSAVLTGISVALGAKATDTDRGNSLKNLIMHGKNVARAVVTILNEGPEAYKPNDYGDRIIVERVLRRDRPHSLFVKNSDKKQISTTKKEVEKILEHFGITIANPMTILTQTEAKTFLAHSTDKDKFNSFMSGTRLKESYDNLRQTKKSIQEINHILANNKSVHDELKKKYAEATKVWKSFADSADFTKRKNLLIGKGLWLNYKKLEDYFDNAQKLLATKNNEIREYEKAKKDQEMQILNYENIKQTLQNGELQKYKDKVERLHSEKSSLKNSATSGKEEARKIENKINKILNSHKAGTNRVSALENDIEKEKRKIEKQSQESIVKLSAFKQKQKDKLGDFEKERAHVDSEIAVLRQDVREKIKKNENSVSALNNNIRNLEYKVSDARQKDHSNRPETALFPAVRKLMSDLSRQSFHDKVTGPLGMEIQLRKEFQRWTGPLESILQRTLGSFLVTNHYDSQLLMSRNKACNARSEITIRQNEIFDYSSSKPNSRFPSILDALRIDDENIKCFLVDSLKLHSTLLIPDRATAQAELDNDRDFKISSVICMVGDNQPLRIFKRNGTFQSDPVHMGQIFNKLRVEGDSMLLRLEREINIAKNEKREKENELKQEVNSMKANLDSLLRKQEQIKNEYRELTRSIDKADQKLEEMQEGTSKLETLIAEKERIEGDLNLLIQNLEPLNIEKEKSLVFVQQQISLYEDVERDYQSANNIFIKKQEQLRRLDGDVEFCRSNIRDSDKEIQKRLKDIEKLSDYIQTTKPRLEQEKLAALEFCTFEEAALDDNTTEDSIQRQIAEIDERLKEAENRHGITKAQAEANLLNARKSLKIFESKYTETIDVHNSLQNAMSNRLQNLIQTTYLTFQEVESVFVGALKIRRFRGKIEFNVKKGTLTLKVATKEDGPLRAVESFSGGEKSYSQIAFLFAIWGPMHSRIRGLDEFDVFMDTINRRIALKLILKKVAENPKRQTIFITPLSVANIEGLDSETVHIHEISPPERANL
ncbi:hypothetical protein CANINC_003877 [Pichia inconspicua]|uniref:Rad50/SbcC-type AAA domain-containing protein n=1 Tax=Pichia inconspicua TaxID=52247 RepID=A0A4T0WXL0_9ASCO|nr:hypothetical protein CANINC_003877 [[Candida] inconspicua]